jgi:hypothetical protein
MYWPNVDNNVANTSYYTIWYMRGNTYFLGCLIAMLTIPGGNRAPRP